jgi:hypothetical protein
MRNESGIVDNRQVTTRVKKRVLTKSILEIQCYNKETDRLSKFGHFD